MGMAFNYMTADMRGKLGGYMTSLEQRYGDPRVYAAQREQMAAEQAEVVYSEAKTHEQALSAAYHKNVRKLQDDHRSRLDRFVRDKPPQYVHVDSRPPNDRTSELQPQTRPPPSSNLSSQTQAAAR